MRHPDCQAGLDELGHLGLHHFAEPVEGQLGVACLVCCFLQKLYRESLLGEWEGASCIDKSYTDPITHNQVRFHDCNKTNERVRARRKISLDAYLSESQ